MSLNWKLKRYLNIDTRFLFIFDFPIDMFWYRSILFWRSTLCNGTWMDWFPNVRKLTVNSASPKTLKNVSRHMGKLEDVSFWFRGITGLVPTLRMSNIKSWEWLDINFKCTNNIKKTDLIDLLFEFLLLCNWSLIRFEINTGRFDISAKPFPCCKCKDSLTTECWFRPWSSAALTVSQLSSPRHSWRLFAGTDEL